MFTVEDYIKTLSELKLESSDYSLVFSFARQIATGIPFTDRQCELAKNKIIHFSKWKKNEVLTVNKFGMLEPTKSKIRIPNLMLVPLLVFDKGKYRLGYGKGFYDRYLSSLLKKFNKILTVGVAFSFQRYDKLPISSYDVKLDFILTEKGLMK